MIRPSRKNFLLYKFAIPYIKCNLANFLTYLQSLQLYNLYRILQTCKPDLTRKLDLYLYFHTCRKLKLHQRIHRAAIGIENIYQALMRTKFELFAALLIDVRRAVNSVDRLLCRKRNWSRDHTSRRLYRPDDLFSRLIDQVMIVRLELYANLLHVNYACLIILRMNKMKGRSLGERPDFNYFVILSTTPAPTVRPPSRIAKRRPSSMAIGVINSIDISMLSPGITISTPVGRVATPVTSVVRK